VVVEVVGRHDAQADAAAAGRLGGRRRRRGRRAARQSVPARVVAAGALQREARDALEARVPRPAGEGAPVVPGPGNTQ